MTVRYQCLQSPFPPPYSLPRRSFLVIPTVRQTTQARISGLPTACNCCGYTDQERYLLRLQRPSLMLIMFTSVNLPSVSKVNKFVD